MSQNRGFWRDITFFQTDSRFFQTAVFYCLCAKLVVVLNTKLGEGQKLNVKVYYLFTAELSWFLEIQPFELLINNLDRVAKLSGNVLVVIYEEFLFNRHADFFGLFE